MILLLVTVYTYFYGYINLKIIIYDKIVHHYNVVFTHYSMLISLLYEITMQKLLITSILSRANFYEFLVLNATFFKCIKLRNFLNMLIY